MKMRDDFVQDQQDNCNFLCDSVLYMHMIRYIYRCGQTDK